MDIDQYQLETSETVKDSIKGDTIYFALGLVGEAGEVAEKIKKYRRDGHWDTEAVAQEVGDVLWYLAQLSKCLEYNLSEIANMNLDKLQSRKRRDKIGGSGDRR